MAALFSGSIYLQKTETDRQQPVLLAYRPGARETEMEWTPSAPVKPGRYDTGHRH